MNGFGHVLQWLFSEPQINYNQKRETGPKAKRHSEKEYSKLSYSSN